MSKPGPKKDNALDIAKLIDKVVRVKLAGGREGRRVLLSTDAEEGVRLVHESNGPPPSFPAVEGTLKGYDQLLNLVLDETIEYLRGEGTRGVTAVGRAGGVQQPSRGTARPSSHAPSQSPPHQIQRTP